MADKPNNQGRAQEDGVIVEFHRVGGAVKVSAIDTRTYEEVSIVAPLNATEREMTDTVLRKLAWLKAKKADGAKGAQPRR